ncbi:LysR family transcriptional regulator [Roseibium sp. RKSG952]|uniref:LysR family transcriptional regulator n=1 Tax=Roseibium sp. RKSG952 TaxID=2529384 RepID=UPI0012BCA610|nr:LysR family transcriptional regulator [Roseibium sp. RKSG952]MTH98204.1 LysR family transcriptional regulator [Roseibium sp. RKSG952]
MSFDTDGLRLFVLAAERLNISSAGRDLGMAPAVASAKLAKLEKSLGAELMHRSTRKVSLSLEGSEFLPYAREILAQEDAGRAALGQGKAMVTGTLRFAASSTFAQKYILPILPDFIDAQPDLFLDLRLSDTQIDLLEGSFDLALRNAVLEDSSLRCRKLADDTRVLCASPAYLEQFGAPTSPEDFHKHRLIAFRHRVPRTMTSAVGETVRLDPAEWDCRVALDDGQSLKLACLSGLGIAENSLWSVHDDLQNGRLVRVLPDFEIAKGTFLWLVYPQTNVLSAKVRVFIDFLLDRIGRNPPWAASRSS